MIPAVESMSNPIERLDARKKCLEIFYRELGDPRFGSLSHRWDAISRAAREIFLHWLAANDLELFFKIIERTAVDRMWSYRRDFWEAYLPYIVNTWVFLGKDARRVAKKLGDKVVKHGSLVGGANDQSAFVFQLGEYVFVEWSHNGKLRVCRRSEAADWFGAGALSRADIVYSNYIEEWVHASPRTYSWQRKVNAWLFENCRLEGADDD